MTWKIRRVDSNEPSILYKSKPEMASGKSSYVHLVAGGYVFLRMNFRLSVKIPAIPPRSCMSSVETNLLHLDKNYFQAILANF